MKSGLVLPYENDSLPRAQDRCFHTPRRIAVCHGALDQQNQFICASLNLTGLICRPRPR